MKQASLDYWRNYFGTANADIFGIIDHAIMVAASDCPKEFRLRRDRIAERLFSCRLTCCSACSRVELAVPVHEAEKDGVDNVVVDDEDDDQFVDIDGDGCEFDEGGSGSKESKVNSNDNDRDNGEVNVNENDGLVSNYSYGEAEALTDEIEEESQIIAEVLRIKDILLTSKDRSDSVLFESLRRLQLMALSVDTLKATEIGKTVNCLRKHGLQQIRHLARTLIAGWKILVDEWYSATKAIGGDEGTTDSASPSVVDEEEGLPSPPLDEGAFFATQTTPIELSQFFDGMDDDGNPQNSREFIKNPDIGRKPHLEKQNVLKKGQQGKNGANVLGRDSRNQQMKKQEAAVKPSMLSNADSGFRRPPKQRLDQKMNNESSLNEKTDKITSQRKPLSRQHDKFKSSDEGADQMKLEATKRKLQERYQQAEKAKRQRTIQVMELHDLPNQGRVHRNPHLRPGNHNRHRAQARW